MHLNLHNEEFINRYIFFLSLLSLFGLLLKRKQDFECPACENTLTSQLKYLMSFGKITLNIKEIKTWFAHYYLFLF